MRGKRDVESQTESNPKMLKCQGTDMDVHMAKNIGRNVGSKGTQYWDPEREPEGDDLEGYGVEYPEQVRNVMKLADHVTHQRKTHRKKWKPQSKEKPRSRPTRPSRVSTNYRGICAIWKATNGSVYMSDMLKRYDHMFNSKSHKRMGMIKGVEFCIDTGDHPPIRMPCRCMKDPAMEADLKKQIDIMLESNIIKRIDNAHWAFPIVMVKKPDMTWRPEN